MMEGMENMDKVPDDPVEYIMNVRGSYQDSDSQLWRERKLEPLTDPEQGSLQRTRARLKSKSIVPLSDEHVTKVLASLVPDEIIYNIDDYNNRHYDSCMLFGDVSGFTDLCEKYSKTGKGGPSRLTVVLNSYIGSMVQEVISHGGDVLKFSGDAFLAMWKSSISYSMQDVVHSALDCAVIIQKTHGSYETDVGIFLRVKLAVSAGYVAFSLIGDAKISHYVVIGQPIWDVKAAEKKSSAGEIIVNINAWHYVNSNEYNSEPLNDGIHTKVLGLGTTWRSTQRHAREKDTDIDDINMGGMFNSSGENEREELDEKSMSKYSKANLLDVKQQDFSLRPSVDDAAKMGIKEGLRKFIIPPVMRGIDLDQPLEYLTEMRQIVILFINVVAAKLPIPKYIELIDDAYKIVCGVVDELEGCVNKVSLFDKDLMFVVLFGLRGYKHELESQLGLRCASECYQAISELPNVLSTSIGVTTGMTYCGIVGHTLRREYTVIGLNVNKAARLMVAYPNKVTCDRETFLHSKMEAKNFILQEYKVLKGITSTGPVYEFKEQIGEHAVNAVNPFPLLGRPDEIKLYLHLLEECLEIQKTRERGRARYSFLALNHHNLLLVHGIPRQGKTRLLDEFIYCTPSGIPVNRFTLTGRDCKVPYETIKLVFLIPLGLDESSTSDETEMKLKKRLHKIKVPELLCALNPVFHVNFEKSTLYTSLNEKQRDTVLQRLMKQLFCSTFVKLWIIAIDDCEFIDDESWSLMSVILDLDLVYMVMCIGNRRRLTPIAEEALKHKRIRSLELSPIGKWYQAGLACQILDVYAIPPELEKTIQSRSNGSPGWIESYLVSLIQASGIKILMMQKSEVYDLGLVSPPVSMMLRQTSDAMKEVANQGVLDADVGSRDVVFTKEDSWKMYQFSYRDSLTAVLRDKNKDKKALADDSVPVCTITPNFRLENAVDVTLNTDVMIIKMFDSLTYNEQLVLKGSAVLGDAFRREMLIYVVASTSPRTTAQAIQKLFEIRILGCAQGDFTQGDTCVVFRKRLENPNLETGIKCSCRGIKISDMCNDLPRYASCGYMRFRLPVFRETTYNLLTDNQRKEFHNRAIKYLEKETRRCRSCGNGFFVKILGTRNDQSFKRKKKKKSSALNSYTTSKEDLEIISNFSLDAEQMSTKSSKTHMGRQRRDTKETMASLDSSVNSEGRMSSADFIQQRWFAFPMLRKLKQSVSLTRTFSSSDFSNCQCPLILRTMYSQMLEHCKEAGHLYKLMEACLEYAQLCIVFFNTPQAMKILEEALAILEESLQGDEDIEEVQWKIPILKGRVFTLMGQARLELGQFEESYHCCQRALNYFGYTFPTSKPMMRLCTMTKELKQKIRVFIFPNLAVGTVVEYEAEYCNSVSKCLGVLCVLFINLQMWNQAELAAVWCLNKALEAYTDFYRMCVAYAHMLEVGYHLGKTKLCTAIEIHALQLCHHKHIGVAADELKAVSNLYAAIFCGRFHRSDITRAIHIGYVMMHLTANIHHISLSLQTLPLLIHALLLQKRVLDAVTMLQDLEYCSEEDTDNSGRTWFYALCVVLHIETGYSLISFKKVEKFYQVEGETLITIRDPDAERRFYTIMWLWCLRNEEWEKATVWYTKAHDFTVVQGDDSIANLFTSLYLLEGLLLFIVAKIDKRNVSALSKAYKEVKLLMKAIKRATKNAKVILPRYYHLKAYYQFILCNDNQAFKTLNKAKKLSGKYQNLLELGWLEHTEKAWKNNLAVILLDFWKEHSEPDTLMDYHEADINGGKLAFFTLPIPLYF